MNKARVTLVSGLGACTVATPNEGDQYAPPLGILTLAARLRDSYEVHVIDLDHYWWSAAYKRPLFQASVVEAIVGTRPDILGFSSISGSYPLTIRLAEECSRSLPEATVVFGGPQATVTDVDTAEAFPFIDLILRGECDHSFPLLVDTLVAGTSIERIPGLTFREGSRVRRNPNGTVTLDLDSLPLPAYELIPSIGKLPALPLEIGRGCPFSCTFCSTNDFFRRQFRLKSPARALEEMHHLHKVYGVTVFDLVHDMFTVDRRRVVAFCETMIGAGSPYKWSCSARTDFVDPELLRLMKQAGCHDIFFGIETGSQRMQGIIDKDLDVAAARRVLIECNDLEIRTTASLIVGYPQETKSDLRDTVDFFSDVMLMPWVDPQFNVLSPLAATPVTTEYRDRLTLDENWASISENGTLQDTIDKAMIAAYPDIFPNFYAFPFFTSRDVIQHLRDFLCFGLARCGGLMRALYLHSGDMLGVFEEWEKAVPASTPDWFSSLDFLHRLLGFSETRYRESRSIAATAGFYRTVYSQAVLPAVRSEFFEPAVILEDEVFIVDAECDINSVLDSLAHGAEPEDTAFTSPVTVAVKLTALNRASILRFPPVTLDLLRHAARGSTLAEIRRDFERRNMSFSGLPPSTVISGGIDYLEGLKLVRRIFPECAERAPETSGSIHRISVA